MQSKQPPDQWANAKTTSPENQINRQIMPLSSSNEIIRNHMKSQYYSVARTHLLSTIWECLRLIGTRCDELRIRSHAFLLQDLHKHENQHNENHGWLTQPSNAFWSTHQPLRNLVGYRPLRTPWDTAIKRSPEHRKYGFPNLRWLRVQSGTRQDGSS